jgi:hypothetical protein
MPDPNNKTKMTGDLHLPDVETDLPLQEGISDGLGADGTPRDRGQAGNSAADGRARRGINHAGIIKDKDDETSDSYGNTRDSGERPR